MNIPTSLRLAGTEVIHKFDDLPESPLQIFGDYKLFYGYEGGLIFVRVDLNGITSDIAIYDTRDEVGDLELKVGVDDQPDFDWLGPMWGLHWYNSAAFYDHYAGTTTSYDAWLRGNIESSPWSIDTPYTPTTGSSRCFFNHDTGKIGQKHGVSGAVAEWFAEHRRLQILRPRHGWQGPYPAGVLGSIPAKVPQYNPRHTNRYGYNGDDAEHTTNEGLYWGWMLTKHPLNLLELVHQVLNLMRHENAVIDPKKAWNHREWGWPLAVYDRFLRATYGIPMFHGLHGEILRRIEKTCDAIDEIGLIIDPTAKPHMYVNEKTKEITTSSTDPGDPWVRALYSHVEHTCTIVHAMLSLEDVLSEYLYEDLALRCQKIGQHWAQWLRTNAYRNDKNAEEIGVKYNETYGCLEWRTNPDGWPLWNWSCVSSHGDEVAKDNGLYSWLRQFVADHNGKKPSDHYRFTQAIANSPRDALEIPEDEASGFSTGYPIGQKT